MYVSIRLRSRAKEVVESIAESNKGSTDSNARISEQRIGRQRKRTMGVLNQNAIVSWCKRALERV